MKMKTKKTNVKIKEMIFYSVIFIILVVYVVALCSLLVWAVMTSFKEQFDFRINIIGLPKKWVWNYTFVYNNFFVEIATESGTRPVYMVEQFYNTILYAVGCAFINTFVTCTVAYLCALFPYKFSKFIYSLVLVVMIIPIYGTTAPTILMAKRMQIYDTIWGQWIMKAHFLGLPYLIFYNTFKGMSQELSEAAKIDGASNLTIYLKILFPLAGSTFLTFFIMSLIGFWNDYSVPLYFMPSKPTVALALLDFSNTTELGLNTIPMRMTGAVLVLIPILIVFLIFNKRLMGNATIGGIKE